MAEDITVGDKVWVISGSSPMVVRDMDTEAATGTPIAECEWLVENIAYREWFAITSLTKTALAKQAQ